jgi:hypothetical protein
MHGAKQNDVFRYLIPLISQEFSTLNTTIISLDHGTKPLKAGASITQPRQKQTGNLAGNGTVVTATLRC